MLHSLTRKELVIVLFNPAEMKLLNRLVTIVLYVVECVIIKRHLTEFN